MFKACAVLLMNSDTRQRRQRSCVMVIDELHKLMSFSSTLKETSHSCDTRGRPPQCKHRSQAKIDRGLACAPRVSEKQPSNSSCGKRDHCRSDASRVEAQYQQR